MVEKILCRLSPVLIIIFFLSCTGQKAVVNTRFGPEELKKDFQLFRNILEESHPGLYWFTPKEEMDQYFSQIYSELSDSLTEREFRTRLMYLAEKIKCGHTSINFSKEYTNYLDTAFEKTFPVSIYFWKDSAMLWSNLNRNDSILTRGSLVWELNNKPVYEIREEIFEYLVGDGYSVSGKYQSLNNGFSGMWKNIYGLKDSVQIKFSDTSNILHSSWLHPFDPSKDSAILKRREQRERPDRKTRLRAKLERRRNLQEDTASKSAYMLLSSFSRGYKLRKFFRASFRHLEKQDTRHLIIDLRNNGGGEAGNAVGLLRYISEKPFKLADSLYAIKKGSYYSRHLKNYWAYWLMMNIVTHKKDDGKYHFGYFERKIFKPVKKYHFSGNVYLLTGGNTFSAASIFAKKLKGQANVKIIGEETGGGAYGNSAWMIPDGKLPNTGIRFRLPKFRMVMDAEEVGNGRGVMPDIEVKPTAEAIKKGNDLKLEKAKQIIQEKNRNK